MGGVERRCELVRDPHGIRPDFILLTADEDRLALLDELADSLAEAGLELPADRKSVLGLIDRLLADSYDGSPEATALFKTPEWVAPLYRAWCQALVAANRLDFGSLLHLSCRLLREKPGVRRVLRLGWTHVCVDEFQDTNKAQYDLLRLLVADARPNLFIVGDDDQIMYQWNGASPERLLALRSDYSMELVQLPVNHRCPPAIIELANKLIVHNKLRTPAGGRALLLRPLVLGAACGRPRRRPPQRLPCDNYIAPASSVPGRSAFRARSRASTSAPLPAAARLVWGYSRGFTCTG